MPSKKVERDEKGHAIVPGGRTFDGYTAKPKGGRKERTNELKDRADTRLLLLMKKGAMADRLTRPMLPVTNNQERKSLEFQKEFAEAPKAAQLAHYNNKLNDLKKELQELEDNRNKKKMEFMRPFLESEIEKFEKKLREAYLDLKRRK